MFRPDGPDTVASKPTPGAAGTEGWFEPGTVFDTDTANLIVGELREIAVLGGQSADKTDHTQCATVLAPVQTLDSDSSDTGYETTYQTRLVAACNTSRASGDRSVSMASNGGWAQGDQSTVVASIGGRTGASSAQAAVIACGKTGNLSVSEATGTAAAVIACTGDRTGRNPTASGEAAAVIACINDAAAPVASGTAAVLVACDGGTVSGTTSAAIACQETDVSGVNPTAAIGCNGSEVTGAHSVLVGSINARLTTDFALALGYSPFPLAGSGDENITILLDGQQGRVIAQELDIDDGVALGGGATPTLGTIGGSGPMNAGQAQWLQVYIGNIAHWIPVWT